MARDFHLLPREECRGQISVRADNHFPKSWLPSGSRRFKAKGIDLQLRAGAPRHRSIMFRGSRGGSCAESSPKRGIFNPVPNQQTQVVWGNDGRVESEIRRTDCDEQ